MQQNNQNPWEQANFARAAAQINPQSIPVTNQLIRRIWGLTSGGLALTAVISFMFGTNERLFSLIAPMIMPLSFGLFFLYLFVGRILRNMSSQGATATFFGLSALNGILLSFVFVVYQMPSIVATFGVTSATFGAMSLYGLKTKRDLNEWRTFLIMGLIGIVIASFANILIKSEAVYWVVTYAGVLVFTGLIAWETQYYRDRGHALLGQPAEVVYKESVFGAIHLYLNFINLFLMLLRFMGVARDE